MGARCENRVRAPCVAYSTTSTARNSIDCGILQTELVRTCEMPEKADSVHLSGRLRDDNEGGRQELEGKGQRPDEHAQPHRARSCGLSERRAPTAIATSAVFATRS